MDSQVTVRVPKDLKRALDEASRKMQRTSSEIVRKALRAFLEEPSDRYARPVGVHRLVGSLEFTVVLQRYGVGNHRGTPRVPTLLGQCVPGTFGVLQGECVVAEHETSKVAYKIEKTP